jgi:bifunctional DNA-binding transcriptional regulator/antitoxin component of YhaV-PrlF toxin-antitoxin module
MALTVISNKDGRITIPSEVRTALHIEGEAHWTAEIVDGALLLRPAVVIPREDAWAYTPDHAAQVRRAREDARAGRTIHVSGQDLARIADLPDEDMDVELERLRRGAASGPGSA